MVGARFQISRFIGRGGMGEVYEAKDLELGTPVAIKTLRPEISADSWALKRFRQEIQLARRISHPNVCRVVRQVDARNALLLDPTLAIQRRKSHCRKPALALATQPSGYMGAVVPIIRRTRKVPNVFRRV